MDLPTRWERPDGLIVDQAGVTDAPRVRALRRAVLAEGPWFITEADEYRETVDATVRRVRDSLRHPTSLLLVARREGQVVGLLQLTGGPLRRLRHTAKLEMLVDAAHRGAGVGRALLECALSWAEAHPELEKIGLAVFADNTRAVELYRRLGFEEEGRRVREYKLADGTYRDDLLLYRTV